VTLNPAALLTVTALAAAIASTAMGVGVVEGLLIALPVMIGLRERIMLAFPDGLRRAIGAGIGAFIAIIGLVNAGLVLHPEDGGTILAIAPDVVSWKLGIFFLGLILGAVLLARRVRGALLISIVVATVAALGGATSSSSNTTYIESASGIEEGGRTGLTAIATGVLCAVAMLPTPIAGVIPAEATAPAPSSSAR